MADDRPLPRPLGPPAPLLPHPRAIWDAPEALTVQDLVRRLERDGITVAGRPSKTVSDALRYEITHHRVRRIGRSLYARGRIPESTTRWMRQRVAAELDRARARRLAA